MAKSVIKGPQGGYSKNFLTQNVGTTLTIIGTGNDQVYQIFGGTTQSSTVLTIIETWGTGSYVKNLGDAEIAIISKDGTTLKINIGALFFKGVITSERPFDAYFSE